ncbi:hypothetical protein ACWD25_38385 [Streptomyces sp. NPDC002920]
MYNHLRRLSERALPSRPLPAVSVGADFTGVEVAAALSERLRPIADRDSAAAAAARSRWNAGVSAHSARVLDAGLWDAA